MFERYDVLPDRPIHIHLIQDERRVDQAVSHLLKFDVLGFDVETYHKYDRAIPAFDPADGARMRLAQFGTPEGRAFVFDLYKVDKRFLYRLFPNPFVCVVHNLKFELKFLMYELGIFEYGPMYDSMLAESILSKGNSVDYKDPDYMPVSLEASVKRRLGVTLPKTEQAGAWYKNELNESQIAYAARDAVVVIPLMEKQCTRLQEQSQVRVNELEIDCVPALASMELNGLKLDEDRWLALCDKTAASLDKVKKELWHLLGNQNTLFDDIAPINLNAKDQIQVAFQRLGIKVPLDRDGKPSLKKDNIIGLDHDAVQKYLKWVKLDKALGSFGPDWLNKRNPYTKRIHCQIKQIGAETGRMSAAGPNLMQMKKDDEYRNAFVAEDGWVFIDADYSQCELRILAEYCRDANLLNAFDHNYDLHRYSAHLIYKCVMELVTDLQRGVAKNLNFGIVYGIGVAKFAAQAGITFDEADAIMRYYLKEAYPQLGQWLEIQGRSVLHTLEAMTMTGRVRRYNVDLNDKQKRAGIQRNAKNMPIQGTNADITKRALGLLYKRIGGNKNVRLILPIHDEILLESQPNWVAYGSYELKACMIQAEEEYLHRVPSVVDVSISLEWAKQITKEQTAKAQELINEWN
jgi:DNA polymerase I-like protein with 3'-5' exonuclease and polymerase domains